MLTVMITAFAPFLRGFSSATDLSDLLEISLAIAVFSELCFVTSVFDAGFMSAAFFSLILSLSLVSKISSKNVP